MAGRVPALLLALVAVDGCLADPPAWSDGSGIGPGRGPYATLATCGLPGPCDLSCAQKATGAPDGQSVDMAGCQSLQLTFTDGTLRPVIKEPDLAVHLTGVGGATRILASKDGNTEFKAIGFVGGSFPLLPPDCEAKAQGNQLLIYIDRCGYLDDISVIRLERDTTISGALQVDAIEALSYKPMGPP